MPFFPIIGSCLIIYLMYQAAGRDVDPVRRSGSLIGLVIYYVYGRHHSRLQLANQRGEEP